jgi:hypothetical protein
MVGIVGGRGIVLPALGDPGGHIIETPLAEPTPPGG